jgi:hypothetical protein
MSYKSVADMAESYSLNRRLTAGAAKESIDEPQAWVSVYRWEIASQPGWDTAWDSAVAGEVPDPGSDEAVITDGMILAGVQAVRAANPAPTADGEPVP